MHKVLVGTSGWNYREWKDTFYNGVPQKRWLEHYASTFAAVEVNATFYRLLQEKTVRQWVERTPENFVFAAKGSRYITHTKRLKEPEAAIGKQQNNLAPMHGKLQVVCWQLPASMQKNMDRLTGFVRALDHWSDVRHAVEFRHTSWFDQETVECLNAHNVGICISDAADWPRWDHVSSDLVYIRLHGNHKTYQSAYSAGELQIWADYAASCRQQGYTVHVYFDNTDLGAAVDNALELASLVTRNKS
jgi:uncharacterized protein YecE (DUF72 family)